MVEPERAELEAPSRRRRRAAPGWCTAAAAGVRRRGAARPLAAAASTTCSQLSSDRAQRRRAGLSRSNSAASPPVTLRAATTVRPPRSGVVAALEPDQPDAGGPRQGRGRPAGGRPRSPGPSCRSRPARRPRRAGGGRRARSTAVDLLVAADELGARATAGCRPGRRRTASSRRLGRRRATHRGRGSAARAACSSGPGSRPSSSASSAPDPPVGRERVGLTAGAVLSGDEQLPQTFLEGPGLEGRAPARRSPHRARRGGAARRTRSRAASYVISSNRARWGSTQSPLTAREQLAGRQPPVPTRTARRRLGRRRQSSSREASAASAPPRSARPSARSTARR